MQYIFRGLTADNQWVYGSLIQRVDGIGKLSLIEVQDKDGEITVHQVKDDTIGMCSGWKDKNGRDIYQDDMLQGMMHEQGRDNSTPHIEQVIFDRGGFTVFNKPMQLGRGSGKGILNCFMWFDKGSNGMRDQYWQIDEIEIIGNIHEVNPASGQAGINYMLDPKEQAAEGQEQQVAATESAAQDKAMEVTESAEEGSTEG